MRTVIHCLNCRSKGLCVVTPDQALRAVRILDLHAPSDPEGYAAALAAIEHLRSQANHPARWVYSNDSRLLLAADPGGVERPLPNISAFAAIAAQAWRA